MVERNGKLALSPSCGVFMIQNNPKHVLPITRLHRPSGPCLLLTDEAQCKSAATETGAFSLGP